MKLKISPDLSLPADAATSTIIVYGGKGMGKTNLASVLVEEFSAAGIRFAVIDPMGVWWGLRHDADGKGKGIEVLILGGIHGDLPITPESGALVADLVVDEDASVIIDISRRADGSMWSIGERIRFVTAYAKRLYQRQGERRRPLNQVIDEAARFAPQIVRQGETDVAMCMGAIAVLVEEGRNVGVGVVLVTQRSARLNKDVAELADCMFAFRIVGPNSMRAVLDWLGEYVEKARIKVISERLRSLPRGSALVVSPGWLEYEGVVEVRKRRTFDSSKTPEAGKQVRASGAGAKPDLAKYRERLSELVEQQKANDPKALKAKIAELIKERDQLSRAVNQPAKSGDAKSKTIERKVIKDSQLTRIEKLLEVGVKLVERWQSIADKMIEPFEQVRDNAADMFAALDAGLGELRAAIASTKQAPPVAPANVNGHNGIYGRNPASTAQVNRDVRANADAPEGLTPKMRAILDALALLAQLGVSPAPKVQVAFYAGASPTSSAYTNNLGALRTMGLIDYPAGGTVALTAAGDKIADGGRAPQTLDDMHAFIRQLVGPKRWAIIAALIRAGGAVPKADLADAAGASANSSAYTNNLGSLRTLGLLDYPTPGAVIATDIVLTGRAAS